MPQTAQSGSLKAPDSRAALDKLIAQRNELQGQLRALDDRRFQLAEQSRHLDGSTDLDRRIKTLDGSIDGLERQIAQANELITAGQARFGGQFELAPPPGAPTTNVGPGVPEAPPGFPFTEVPSTPPVPDSLGRALLLEGVGFVLLGAVAWVWAVRRLERRLGHRTPADPGQMKQLQQSVDAIAVEVERISENQRWVTKQMNERVLGGGEAQPVTVGKPESARVPRER
jgi:hypothetical protein